MASRPRPTTPTTTFRTPSTTSSVTWGRCPAEVGSPWSRAASWSCSPRSPTISRVAGVTSNATPVDLDQILARHGLTAVPVALDPVRPARRLLRTPRYDAMQDYFDRRGESGLTMMTGTAAVQINLDAGADAVDVARRWSLLHAVGPALVAAFANSPLHLGRVTGWKSTRQRVVSTMDPTRGAAPRGPDPVTAWAEYALDAPVMMCRREGDWLAAPGFTFRDWVGGITGFAPPTDDDLAYHLTTLFPPVRPRAGWRCATSTPSRGSGGRCHQRCSRRWSRTRSRPTPYAKQPQRHRRAGRWPPVRD